MMSMVQQLLHTMAAQGLQLRTAESCTAGAIAAAVAAVPGASQVLDRGWVVYSNAAKQELLGVSETLIMTHGAVSREVVQAMAEGGCSEGALCVAVSGIAGPTGGTPDKPVGMVWMAVAGGGKHTVARCHQFPGDRAEVQRATVQAAIQSVLDYLK